MIPRLYDFSSASMSHYTSNNGYGFLAETSKCEVKRVLGGDYTISLEVATSDPIAKEVVPNRAIFVEAEPSGNPQLFIISSVSVTDEKVVASGEHVSSAFLNNMYVPGAIEDKGGTQKISGTPTEIYSYLANSAAVPPIFNFISAISDSEDVILNLSATLTWGNIFTDKKSGMLKVFHDQAGNNAELDYDNFNVYFKRRVGSTTAKNVVRYGSNVSSFEQVMSGEEEYTHVLPYATIPVKSDYNGNTSAVTLFGLDLINNRALETGSTSPFLKVLPVDFSRFFKDKGGYVNPSTGSGYVDVQNALRDYGQAYIDLHPSISNRSVTIKVDYGEALESFDKIHLGDNVQVIYEPIDYRHQHRVKETLYDTLSERYKSITIGERKYNLYQFLKDLRS